MADVDVREATVPELVQRMTEQTATLVRQEMQLALAEMEDKAKKAGAGAGLLTGAGVVALGAFGAFIAGAILAIGEGLPMWLSAFIVTAGLLIIAGIAAMVGKQKVTEAVPPAPEESIESIKTDVARIKEAASR